MTILQSFSGNKVFGLLYIVCGLKELRIQRKIYELEEECKSCQNHNVYANENQSMTKGSLWPGKCKSKQKEIKNS